MSTFSELTHRSLDPAAQVNVEHASPPISVSATFSGKLESFITATRQLEESLALEKKKNLKLKQDYSNAYSTYEKMLQELQVRVREYEINETRLKTKIVEKESSEEKINHQLKEVTIEERKIRSELSHYKTAWADVLTREKNAKKAIIDVHQIQLRANELELQNQSLQQLALAEKNKREQYERQALGYQRELQSTLVRIHGSESKYNEINKKLQAVSQVKLVADEEILKLENSMRERFKWELATERERIKAELEKDAVLDRERFREISRKSAGAEVDKVIAAERDHAQKILEQLQEELRSARAFQSGARQELSNAKEETEVLKQEYAQLKESCSEIINQKTAANEGFQAQIMELNRQFTAIQSELQKEIDIRTEQTKEHLQNQDLVREYETETVRLQKALTAETERADSLKTSLIEAKTQFDLELQALGAEFQVCLSDDPLKDRVVVKDAELKVIADQLAAGDLPEEAVETLVESRRKIAQEREFALERLQASEAFTEFLVKRIDYVTGLNTVVAQPDEKI